MSALKVGDIVEGRDDLGFYTTVLEVGICGLPPDIHDWEDGVPEEWEECPAQIVRIIDSEGDEQWLHEGEVRLVSGGAA